MTAVANLAPFYATVAVSAIGAIGGSYYAYQLYQEKKNNQLPEEWVEIGRVSRLYAYPLKSSGPVALDEAECCAIGLKKGLLRDRIFMIVDTEDYYYVKTVNNPEVLNIKTHFKEENIVVMEHPKMESIQIDLEEVMKSPKELPTSFWTSPVTYDCGDEVSRWVCRCLNTEENSFRLAYYGKDVSPPLIKNGLSLLKKFQENDLGALAAVSSFHLINEASLDDLNSRLKDPVPDIHFRPNIVVSTSKPFDEDNWKFVKIGQNIFQVVYPCFRCHVVTMDPKTGERHKDREPLATLRTYRLAKDPEVRKISGNSPLMGVYMALRSGPGGPISPDEPFYVSY